jgi:hypothetical protein
MNDAAREPGEQPGLEEPPARPPVEGLEPPPGSFAGYPPPTGAEPARYEYGSWPLLPAVHRSHWPRQAEVRWAVVVIAALALVGLGAGALWIGLAPRQSFLVVKAGEAIRSSSEGEAFVAGDGWYFFITLAVGVLAGMLAWLPRSGRGPLMPLALAVGGAAGALVTWVFGEWLTPHLGHDALQRVGATLLFQVQLKAEAAVVVEAFAAVVVYLILAGFAERDDLGNPDRT